ncbi:RNA polymerase sigma factor [Acetobacter sp. DmW_136]|uniref:RNA polymerase sigma factor n=1 Tax=Acetobacter sp. DmW_136 TaxID=2591091 RepID=UPI00140DA058|nr:RNA polymerase sigma factor [Acetobacter sp. DmW_136]
MAGNSDLLTCYLANRGDLLKYAAGITGDYVHAEDLLQEVWIRCQSSEKPEKPLHFLYRVVRNLAVDKYRAQGRARKRFVQTDDSTIDSVPAPTADAETNMSGRQELAVVMAALDGLPEKTKRAVLLCRFEGWKLREIAVELDIPIGSVHRMIAQGLEHCRKHLYSSE